MINNTLEEEFRHNATEEVKLRMTCEVLYGFCEAFKASTLSEAEDTMRSETHYAVFLDIMV